MTVIPYEEFHIKESVLNRLIEAYADRKINEYFTQHGEFPDAEIISSFHTLPTDLMEKYKKFFYTKYYHDKYHYEQEHGPSKEIEVSFDFPSVGENNYQILGSVKSPILGEGISGNSEEYLYDYWNIAVCADGQRYAIGSFTSLSGVTLRVNTVVKYTFWVYHRKSNHQYERTMSSLPIDNTFHPFTGDDWSYFSISDYRFDTEDGEIIYDTQLEDKEYIGGIVDFEPSEGRNVTCSVYTFNPRVVSSVSGVVEGLYCYLRYGQERDKIKVTHEQGGGLITDGNIECLTQTSETSFDYLITRDKLYPSLGLFSLNGIDNPQCTIFNYISSWVTAFISDREIYPTCYGVSYRRNGIEYNQVMLPTHPEGTEIDTGFEIDAVDD